MRSPTKYFLMLLSFIGFLTILSSLLNILYSSNYYENNHHLDTSLSLNNREFIFGSSGKLFTGEKVRSYEGKRSSFFPKDQTLINNIISTSNTCSRWGVVTTIFELSESVLKIGKLADSNPSWCLVIVLDKNGNGKKTYDQFSSNRVIILDIYEQQRMSKRVPFIQKLPWKHFSRKNIGYYFAISQGAEIIFDFDDDNLLINENDLNDLFNNDFINVIEPVIEPVTEPEDGLGDDLSFNPYPSFMNNTSDSLTWPRGFPLDRIKASDRKSLPFLRFTNHRLGIDSIGVIQSLANHDPDVDAIYRMTRPLPLNFNNNNQKICLPKGRFSPFNAQATIWFKEAFPGLFLPISVHGRVSDIWRSYISEILMSESNLRLVFSPPLVIQERNPHNYLKDFQAELPLYLKTNSLISFLHEWRSEKTHWSDVLQELIIELYERDFIEIEDIEVYQLWIQSLLNLRLSNNGKKEVTTISCLFDPFCWMKENENFDWKKIDPPEYKCDQKKSLRFYDFNIHDGVMMDHSNLIETSLNRISGTNHEVFHWNYKKSKPANERSINPLKNSPIKTLPLSKFADDNHAKKIWDLFSKSNHFLETDALIFGFLPADFQFFLQFNKSVIIDSAHRINLLRCTVQESLNTFQTLKNMKERIIPKHIIGSHYLYDLEYIKYYTGITPILLPATQLDSIGEKYIFGKTNGKLFINGHINPKEMVEILNDGGHFDIIHSDSYFSYDYKSISEMKAIIYLPYSISNYKFIDHYAMNIPIFSPSPKFAIELNLYFDRTVSGNKNYCPEMSKSIPSLSNSSNHDFNPQFSSEDGGDERKDHELFWIKFAEVYNLPCITIFDSWRELLEKLKESDLNGISSCMNQANKWRKFEALQNWCWVTKQISSPNGEISQERPSIIENSLFRVQ